MSVTTFSIYKISEKAATGRQNAAGSDNFTLLWLHAKSIFSRWGNYLTKQITKWKSCHLAYYLAYSIDPYSLLCEIHLGNSGERLIHYNFLIRSLADRCPGMQSWGVKDWKKMVVMGQNPAQCICRPTA